MSQFVFFITNLIILAIKITHILGFGVQKAEFGQFPSTIIFEDLTKGRLFAGGVIIHAQYVLTSSFSIQHGSLHALVVAGQIDFDNPLKENRQIRAVTHHYPRILQGHGESPLEILRLDKPFKIDQFVKVAKLTFQKLKKEVNVQIAALGEVIDEEGSGSSTFLMFANLTIASKKKCYLEMPELEEEYMCLHRQNDQNFTMDYTNIGAPVYLDGKVVGILSPIVDEYSSNFSTMQLLKPHAEWINTVLSIDTKHDSETIAISVDETMPSKRTVLKKPDPGKSTTTNEAGNNLDPTSEPNSGLEVPKDSPLSNDSNHYEESTNKPDRTNDAKFDGDIKFDEEDENGLSDGPLKRKHKKWPSLVPNSKFQNQIRENDLINEPPSESDLESKHYTIDLAIKVVPSPAIIGCVIVYLYVIVSNITKL